MKKYRPGPKTGLVTHKGCLDGTGSALMFLWAGGRRENILFRNPSTCDLTPEEAAPFDEVWFADLCPSQMRDPAGGKPFHVFDHHASNARKFVDDANCTFSMSHSGTSLFARELGIDGLHQDYGLIPSLEAYDLGRFDDPDGMFLADLASSYTQEEMLDLLAYEGKDIFDNGEARGRVSALSSMRKIYADSLKILSAEVQGYKAGVVSSPVYWKNEAAQRVLDAGYELAVVVDTAGGMVSLRSRPDGPDCSMIAGRYGGGGHPRAAGFKADGMKLQTALFNEVFG